LRLRGVYGPDLLFEVHRQVESDLLEELIKVEPRDRTLLGVPLAPLPKNARRASFELSYGGQTVISGYPVGIDVTIVNESKARWPALATVGEHLVTVGYRWEDLDGSVLDEERAATRLAYDLRPGESVHQRVAAIAPMPGEARLVIGLVQDGEWFPTTAEAIAIEVHPSSALRALDPEADR
jgi:hypothetical protein